MPRIMITNSSEDGRDVFLEGMGDATRLAPGDSLEIDFEGGQHLALGTAPGDIDDLVEASASNDHGGIRPRGEAADYERDDGTARSFRKRRELDATQEKTGAIPPESR